MNMNTPTNYPSVTTVTPLIDLFKICPVGFMDRNEDDVFEMLQEGLLTGYLIHPSCDVAYIKDWIEDIDMQYNSTFYKTWADVTNKDRFELIVDQLLHYMTTYGTDFKMGAGYVPNLNPEEPAWNTYTVINPCTFGELYAKCMQMLVSGIALKSETVKYLTNYVIEYCNYNGSMPDVDEIKNREALVIICDALDILPKDGAKMFAHLIYKITGQTMIVKNRSTRNIIKYELNTLNKKQFAEKFFKNLTQEQLIALAGVFNRYKELFLTFKSADNLYITRAVNKIGHLSKKHHKPMKRGFWETILHSNPIEVMKELPNQIEKVNNFKLIQVMQSIRERLLLAAGQGENMYIIRNGKIFIKDNIYNAIDSRYFHWEEIYFACREQLIKNLSSKACKIKLPEQYTLACPTSEKNFIGDFPMGTACKMGENSVIGIYWRNDWGTRDFDLSFNDVHGGRIGWNSGYYNEDQSVIYSGDITNAPNGANEVIHFRGTASHPIPNGVVNVNRYYGDPGSKYKVFFGTDDWANVQAADTHNGNYMVDPNKLQLEAEIKQDDMSQQTLGMIINGYFYFFNLSCGYGAVTTAIRKKNGAGKFRYDVESLKQSTEETINIIRRKAQSAISLKEILVAAGFKIVKKDEDIDLCNVDRSTLIELFS